jgi:hypothetical protein
MRVRSLNLIYHTIDPAPSGQKELMSSNTDTSDAQAKRQTKHVTTACLGCRRRKIKCDGVSPRCSNCILYGQECVFQHGVDKRKIAPKERLQALTSYCQQLESLLIANGISLPPPPPMHVQNDLSDGRATASWTMETPICQDIPPVTDQSDIAVSRWPGKSSPFPHTDRPAEQ